MPYFEHFITFVIMGTFSSTSDFFNSLQNRLVVVKLIVSDVYYCVVTRRSDTQVAF